jgi:uncharacterized membrane protein
MEPKSELCWVVAGLIITLILCERARRTAAKAGGFADCVAVMEAQYTHVLANGQPEPILPPPAFFTHLLAIVMYAAWFFGLLWSAANQMSHFRHW